MFVNYRSYYRMIFMAVTTLAEENIGAQKEDKLFLLESHNFQNYCKVNIQQNIVLIHIPNYIKKHQL